MNIFARIKNNLEYAHYRMMREKAVAEMEKHQFDADDQEFKKWAKIALDSLNKCLEIPLK